MPNKKMKEIISLDKKGREERLKELNLEIVKAGIRSHKSHTKAKEIKRARARILTLNKSEKAQEFKKTQ